MRTQGLTGSGELWAWGWGWSSHPSACLSVCLDHRTFPLEPQELATPTLLLWGEKDPYFEQGLVEAISSRFVPGRLEAHILPGMGHWIRQTNPVEMHQYMWAFLQDLLD